MNRELFCPPSVSLRSFLDSERLVAAMLNLVYLAIQAGGEVTYEWKWDRQEESKNLFSPNKKIKKKLTFPDLPRVVDSSDERLLLEVQLKR